MSERAITAALGVASVAVWVAFFPLIFTGWHV